MQTFRVEILLKQRSDYGLILKLICANLNLSGNHEVLMDSKTEGHRFVCSEIKTLKLLRSERLYSVVKYILEFPCSKAGGLETCYFPM